MTNQSTPTHVTSPMTDASELSADDMRQLLRDLIQIADDGVKGFRTAADALDDSALAGTFEALADDRHEIADRLRNLAATKYGMDVDDKGTVGGALRRGWMRLKDAVTGDNPGAIVSVAEEAEDEAVAAWGEALERPLPDEIDGIVRAQYVAIKKSHDRVRSLEKATA